MAELAASVISIAHAVCMLIENSQKALKYIEEVKSINDPINDLLDKVRSLERLTKTVKSTYQRAELSFSSNSRSLRDVRKALESCQERLKNLKPLAFELAALKSETWREKLTIKKRLDKAKENIKIMKEGILWDINMLNVNLTCLNMDRNESRRESDPVVECQCSSIPMEMQPLTEDNISPLSRSLSNAETIFGHDPDLQLRRFSTSQSFSPRPSISSTSSHAPSRHLDRNNSVTSAAESLPLTSKNEWKDFDFHIVKCGSRKQERIDEIREILQRHSDGSALARSTDASDRTPLHTAAQRGDIDLARVLIDEYNADINAQDSRPHSILDLAVAGRHLDFVALLLERGVAEASISARHKKRFMEMKRTIFFAKQAASKTRALSQSSQSGIVT